MKNPHFTFVDLFAGIGGLRRGFEEQGGECVWTCELDAYAVKTYCANFSVQHPIWGDIKTATVSVQKNVPKHDVLLAGFPCQPFSLAGVSKKNSLGRPHGFLDQAQGTLFYDIASILKARKPKAFLLENVKNLASHDSGKTFKTIVKILDELGYDVQHRIINASSWVPQSRQRIYLVGFRKEDNVTFNWDMVACPSVGPKLSSILHGPDEEPEHPFTVRERGRTRVSEKYTLSDNLWQYLKSYAIKHKAKGNGFGCSVVGPDQISRTLSARYYKDGSEILIDRGVGNNPRRLTPRECARLMGFDYSSTSKPMSIPVSDTRAYKQFGNSVVVPVIREIAKAMCPLVFTNSHNLKKNTIKSIRPNS